MFGIGIPELVLIMGIALIVLGPDKLPQLARQIARFTGELKKASEDFKKQLEVEKLGNLKDIANIKENAVDDVKQTLKDLTWPDDIKGHPADKEALEKEKADQPVHGNTPGGLGPAWKEAGGPASRASVSPDKNNQGDEDITQKDKTAMDKEKDPYQETGPEK